MYYYVISDKRSVAEIKLLVYVLRKIGSQWSRALNTNARLLHKRVKRPNSLIHHSR